ncbi:uncharacterized protein LOC116208437 [Punica granatum]|uniref:Uncharacterized protein LOC116208437 n=1 Tax=Punica granatum TaxID=22663 RepID=A0A6P8DTN5_PUNGR|nr:uncharacterized protein LOC116208437 [Punica granatum]
MEGVGARLGRSSTRYGPAVVFTGRVRKWKKRWVHVSPSSAPDPSGNAKHGTANGGSNHSQIRSLNGSSVSSNGSNNGSHLLLYKWTPLSQSSNGNGNGNGNGRGGDAVSNGDDSSAAAEEPPKRRFKFVPIAVLDELKNEDLENENNDDEEAKPSDMEPGSAELNSKSNALSEKPDINDVPMEENQENNQSIRQDLNESTLDLSLG